MRCQSSPVHYLVPTTIPNVLRGSGMLCGVLTALPRALLLRAGAGQGGAGGGAGGRDPKWWVPVLSWYCTVLQNLCWRWQCSFAEGTKDYGCLAASDPARLLPAPYSGRPRCARPAPGELQCVQWGAGADTGRQCHPGLRAQVRSPWPVPEGLGCGQSVRECGGWELAAASNMATPPSLAIQSSHCWQVRPGWAQWHRQDHLFAGAGGALHPRRALQLPGPAR